jgi:hypothetical protein
MATCLYNCINRVSFYEVIYTDCSVNVKSKGSSLVTELQGAHSRYTIEVIEDLLNPVAVELNVNLHSLKATCTGKLTPQEAFPMANPDQKHVRILEYLMPVRYYSHVMA